MTGATMAEQPVTPAEVKYITTMPQDSKIRVREIKRVILEEEAKARRQYPILNYQDAIGLAFFLGSLTGVGVSAYAYMTGALAWYLTIPSVALFVGVLHELEHDLIHNQYFKGQKWMQSIMFGAIWLAKFHANPWWRRDIHHWHHRVSGQPNDIEERILGLGMSLGLARLGVCLHPQGFMREVKQMKKDAGDAFDVRYMNKCNIAPAGLVHSLIKAFPIMLALRMMGVFEFGLIFPAVRDFMVILVYPLILRQTCLVAMSTGCHYYGDIPEHNVYFQNQILNHWLLTPFQIFCWGFGGTHIIHHYVPNQPFYLRSVIATPVWEEMKKQGVRNNDWGVILRANRWNITEEQSKWAGTTAAIWFTALIAVGAFWVFIWDIAVTPVLSYVVLMSVVRPVEHLIFGRKVLFTEKKEVPVEKKLE
jgi:fatty acid desaturase